MSDKDTQTEQSEALGERIAILASEVATLRESIITAAEWDAEARQVRQLALDTTLTEVRRWMHILVGVVVVLAFVVIWLVIQLGARLPAAP